MIFRQLKTYIGNNKIAQILILILLSMFILVIVVSLLEMWQWTNTLGRLASIFSSVAALLLPLIIKIEEKNKILEIQQENIDLCKTSLLKIIEYICIGYSEESHGIKIKQRGGLLIPILTLEKNRDLLFSIGITISGQIQQHGEYNISIIINDFEAEFELLMEDFGKVNAINVYINEKLIDRRRYKNKKDDFIRIISKLE